MSAWYGQRVFYTCDKCGKHFTWSKKSVAVGDKRYCSKECSLDQLQQKEEGKE